MNNCLFCSPTVLKRKPHTGVSFLLIALFWLLPRDSGQAILWNSSAYHCAVSLPDGTPQVGPWVTMMPADATAEATGITGARRVDKSAIVFLGIVHLNDKPHFQLNEKTIGELTGPFFGKALGFQHDVKPITNHGLAGYRITGTHRYFNNNYNIVVDMFQANGLVYQLAALSETDDPLKDGDLRSFLQSFRLTR